MQTDVGIIAIMLICSLTFIAIVKMLINGRVWNKLIESNMLREGLELQNLSMLTPDKLAWLKWGIVIIAFSLSLILFNMILVELADELKIGISGLFIGIALVVSYRISVKHNQDESERCR